MSTLLNELEKEEYAGQLRAHFAEMRYELLKESQSQSGRKEAQYQRDRELDGCVDLLFDLNYGLSELSRYKNDLKGITITSVELDHKYKIDDKGNIT